MLLLASTHHGLRRTFLGALVMIVPDVPVRASGRRRNAAASVLRLAITDHVLPRHIHRNTRENLTTGDKTLQRKSSKSRQSILRPHNVLTLSCKNRLTCLPQEAARRLPRLNATAGANCSRRDARVQFEAAPRRLRRRASGPAVFVSL